MEGLAQLHDLERTAPRYSCFDGEDLNEISFGVNLERYRLAVADGTYLADLGPKIDWWLALWEVLVEVNPDEELYKAAAELVDDVIAHWARIRLRHPAVEELAARLTGKALDALYNKTTDADLDLIARYRRVTCFLSDLARKTWPGIDLGWLWAQA